MLKGKSTIQLFNAKSGKLEHQQENTNIVTNAVQDILTYNDPLGWGARIRQPIPNNGIDTDPVGMGVQQFHYLMPLTTVAFGGLLLWDSNIAEDPTITMPPNGVGEIGHAGGDYSGGNSFRGSHNNNESGIINEDDRKGYRHVWDFGTDKANGTIKSLSLTSFEGGNNGYMNDNNDYNCSLVSYDWCAAYNGSIRNSISKNQIAVPNNESINTSNFLYVKKENDGSIYGLLVKYSSTNVASVIAVTMDNPVKLSLTSGLKLPYTSKVIIENIPAIYTGSTSFGGVTGRCIYVYNNEIHSSRVSNGKIQSWSYTLDGTLTKNIEITLPRTPYNSSDVAFFYNGEYYYRSGNSFTFYKTNAAGEDLGIGLEMYHFNNYGAAPLSIKVNNDGNLYIIYGNTSNYTAYYATILYPDGNYHSTNRGIYYEEFANIAITPFKTPFNYYMAFYNKQYIYTNCYLGVDNRYLATINNLASPVTKTEAQTMKVTYEITEA